MKFKAYTGITWSVLELTGLLEDEDSRVYFEKFKKHLGLHPFHLTNLNAALNEILSSNLNSYDPDVKGFLLDYKNPKLLTPLGEIFYDTCFIHVDIEADFYIFRPEVGCTLKGIVNKKGLHHIGILVHKAFNVSIPKPDNKEDWPGDNLEIGQEVRFVVTLLDYTGKLPFIRGALNPDDYLRGCRLMQKDITDERLSTENNIENDNIENSVNRISEKSVKHAKKYTFFATDSENTSDEDVPQIKKETVRRKKSMEKVEEEKPIEYIKKKKKDKKNSKQLKEMNETKPDLIEAESVHDQYMNNLSMNGGLVDSEEPEDLNDSKRKIKKKLKIQSSQSSTNEDDNEESIKHSPSKKSKKLSVSESKVGISKIKSEHHVTSSDVEQITEDSMHESKPKIKKNSLKKEKGKNFDDSDSSAVDFTANKYIKNSRSPSKKSSKRIKTEELNNEYIDTVNDDIQESPKKQHKKQKHSLKLDVSESEMDTGEIPVKKHSRKSSILESELVFQNIKIKKEITSGSENTQDEDYKQINKIRKRDSDLNTSSFNYDIEEDEDNLTNKKRKKRSKKMVLDTSIVKVEPGFEEVVVKVEQPDNYDSIIENVNSEQDTSIPKINSPKKRHSNNLNNNIDNDDIEIKSNIKHLKKKEVGKEDRSVIMKTEKCLLTDVSDIDNNDANFQHTEKKKKSSKNSPQKQLNKSRESESDIQSESDFKKVKIKTERFLNS